jgi:hypothetical protein
MGFFYAQHCSPAPEPGASVAYTHCRPKGRRASLVADPASAGCKEGKEPKIQCILTFASSGAQPTDLFSTQKTPLPV